jgi:hypothetical protein
MEAWLSVDVKRLRELKPGIETTVAKLEARCATAAAKQQAKSGSGVASALRGAGSA